MQKLAIERIREMGDRSMSVRVRRRMQRHRFAKYVNRVVYFLPGDPRFIDDLLADSSPKIGK